MLQKLKAQMETSLQRFNLLPAIVDMHEDAKHFKPGHGNQESDLELCLTNSIESYQFTDEASRKSLSSIGEENTQKVNPLMHW